VIWPPPRPEPPEPDTEPADSDGWPPLDALEVHEHPNPVVATLHAPDGAVLIELRERRQVPFGYRP
jgi:hypothetical protein